MSDHHEPTTHDLPDGSVAVVEPTGHNSSLVSRHVDGACVWGQAFACGPREDHVAQVDDIVAEMAERPSDFRRWYL